MPTRRNLALIAGTAVVASTAVYGITALTRNPVDPACRAAQATARRIAPLIRGEVAAMTPADVPVRVASLTMKDSDGTQKSLADWQGRTVLLNLWATWCVPCRQEMPALDALQERLGGPNFQVVAVNIDTRDPEKPKAWLKNVGVSHLAYYADPSAKIFTDLKLAGKALGMPTTMLVDGAGCEIATLAGPAEWASEDAIRLVTGVVTR
jgi:thiol-disulfide isomerase/thioredoxin